MNLDSRAVKAYHLHIGLDDSLRLQCGKHSAEHSVLAPPVHANVDCMPISIGFRQRPPFAAVFRDIQDRIDQLNVITPAMVRKKDDGRYEMISGHRRKHASERLGLETLRCEVVEVSRDEAIILMVDSNAQRSEILPCDKGRAYKMKFDAIKRQGQRTDLTSDPVGPKLERSNTELAEETSLKTEKRKQRDFP